MLLKQNVIANYLGQAWSALMGLAFIPLYIKYLGIESYGLIGMFALLQIWLTLLDMGMTPTLSRELARFMGGAHTAKSIHDLLRSVEIVAVAVAIVIAVGIWAASDWLATDWLRAEKLPESVIAQAFTVMGVVTALRFIEGIYRSSIVGLQRQVLFNVINSVMATLRGLGAVGILAWVSPTIEAFFLWQGLLALVAVAVFRRVAYTTLPETDCAGHFSIEAVRGVCRFAGGLTGITFLALLLTQVDKILLSRLLSLSEYGYYTLAAVVASGLYMLVSPITQAYFPRLSELRARNDEDQLIRTFHMGAQLVTVTMGSAGLVLVAFSELILRLWTQDAGMVANGVTLLSILSLGNLLNCLMWMPYQMQLAYGWTSFAVRVNLVSVAVLVPAIFWVTPRYGAEGAAWVWVALNAGYVLIGIHFMYRRILITEKWRWYLNDVIQPLSAAGLFVVAGLWATPQQMTGVAQLAWLITVSLVTLMVATLAARTVRETMFANVKQFVRMNWLTKTA